MCMFVFQVGGFLTAIGSPRHLAQIQGLPQTLKLGHDCDIVSCDFLVHFFAFCRRCSFKLRGLTPFYFEIPFHIVFGLGSRVS